MRLHLVLESANKFKTMLPLFLEGEVVKGFGRGSKDLGCPTANYSLSVVQKLPKDLEPGVYYGWAQINPGEVHKMVANIGWCPFYQNKEKSVAKDQGYFELNTLANWGHLFDPSLRTYAKSTLEVLNGLLTETHIMHKFDGDFYGSNLKVCILGYLREEKNFSSLDALIKQIKDDIANAKELLEQPDAQQWTSNNFFNDKTK